MIIQMYHLCVVASFTESTEKCAFSVTYYKKFVTHSNRWFTSNIFTNMALGCNIMFQSAIQIDIALTQVPYLYNIGGEPPITVSNELFKVSYAESTYHIWDVFLFRWPAFSSTSLWTPWRQEGATVSTSRMHWQSLSAYFAAKTK